MEEVRAWLAPDPEYDRARADYELKLENWQQQGQFLDLPEPTPPEHEDRGPIPMELALYLQCRRWGCLLVAGGLQDQPAWTFDLVDLAGAVYERMMAESDRSG